MWLAFCDRFNLYDGKCQMIKKTSSDFLSNKKTCDDCDERCESQTWYNSTFPGFPQKYSIQKIKIYRNLDEQLKEVT